MQSGTSTPSETCLGISALTVVNILGYRIGAGGKRGNGERAFVKVYSQSRSRLDVREMR